MITIFDIVSMLGGLAFFLYGMHMLSASLEKMSGGKLTKVLEKLTGNVWKSVALGAGITALVQSSSKEPISFSITGSLSSSGSEELLSELSGISGVISTFAERLPSPEMMFSFSFGGFLKKEQPERIRQRARKIAVGLRIFKKQDLLFHFYNYIVPQNPKDKPIFLKKIILFSKVILAQKFMLKYKYGMDLFINSDSL